MLRKYYGSSVVLVVLLLVRPETYTSLERDREASTAQSKLYLQRQPL